jgi:hypothetical protein
VLHFAPCAESGMTDPPLLTGCHQQSFVFLLNPDPSRNCHCISCRVLHNLFRPMSVRYIRSFPVMDIMISRSQWGISQKAPRSFFKRSIPYFNSPYVLLYCFNLVTNRMTHLWMSIIVSNMKVFRWRLLSMEQIVQPRTRARPYHSVQDFRNRNSKMTIFSLFIQPHASLSQPLRGITALGKNFREYSISIKDETIRYGRT